MFGLSLPKILFTVLIIGVVWYGFRWFQARQGQVGDSARPKKPVSGAGKTGPSSADLEDMTECPVCGTYVVARGARSCGKDGCPYRGE